VANLDAHRIKVYIWIDARQGGSRTPVRQPGGGSEAHERMAIEHDLYFISMAARLLDMHPQTLRKYERLGLVRPTRTVGSMRVYSEDELERLRLIKHLVDEVGVNLAGVQRLLVIAESVQRLRPMVRDESGRPEMRKRLAREIERIGEMVGL
jgi:MerR family transcriptional regulator/heat shock protein HspR